MVKVLLFHGRSEVKLGELGDNSVDSIVTDPPYGLSFMGKHWDYDVPSIGIWKECLRVLKPGGHLLSFGGSRTYHRMVVNIEDAGFEIRDQIMWVYGSGFPKSLNIGKAVDKMQGNEREVVGISSNEKDFRDVGRKVKEIEGIDKLSFGLIENAERKDLKITKGTSDFEGWGTALKPAHEPIVLARKPIGEKSIAENCLKWGTGGLNIDGCRVETDDSLKHGGVLRTNSGDDRNGKALGMFQNGTINTYEQNPQGRFPANFIHDGSDDVVGLFPDTKSVASQRGKVEIFKKENSWIGESTLRGHNDSGSAARYFYCAKASKADRDEGLEVEEKFFSSRPWCDEENYSDDRGRIATRLVSKVGKNHHPTVKPTSLMRYLCKLITPKGGTVLDPFMGSGSTGKAAVMEGFRFIGVEMEAEYVEIARARIAFAEGLVEEEVKKVDAQLKLF